jgi:hypothetical protein
MTDPIIEKIHKFREEYAKRFNYDVKAMFEDLRKRQAGNPNVVDLSEQAAEKHQHVAEEPGEYGDAPESDA